MESTLSRKQIEYYKTAIDIGASALESEIRYQKAVGEPGAEEFISALVDLDVFMLAYKRRHRPVDTRIRTKDGKFK